MAQPQQATYTIGSQDTVPASETLSGTWSCNADSKFLYGTTGAATTQAQRGWWLYDATNDEIRRIEKVDSNNAIVLETGFTNALSGATIRRITTNGLRKLSVRAAGDVTLIDANDNSTTLLDTNTINLESRETVGSGVGLIEPYIVDPGVNDADITYAL